MLLLLLQTLPKTTQISLLNRALAYFVSTLVSHGSHVFRTEIPLQLIERVAPSTREVIIFN